MNDQMISQPRTDENWKQFESWWATQDVTDLSMAMYTAVRLAAWNGWLASSVRVEQALALRGEPVAWGLPNTAITGKKQALMMVSLEVPSDDQYGGAMWVPLQLGAQGPDIERLTIERCARACEKRAEARFEENGTTESDTNASYYGGRCADEYATRDEEDEDCAAAIRSLPLKAYAAPISGEQLSTPARFLAAEGEYERRMDAVSGERVREALDARRYRWLRDESYREPYAPGPIYRSLYDGIGGSAKTDDLRKVWLRYGKKLDDAIDAALPLAAQPDLSEWAFCWYLEPSEDVGDARVYSEGHQRPEGDNWKPLYEPLAAQPEGK